MNREYHCEEILILEQARSQGCLLRLLDREDGSVSERIEVTGQFDCPLTWTIASAKDLTLYPHALPVRAWKYFDLTLRCGKQASISAAPAAELELTKEDAGRRTHRQRPSYSLWVSIFDWIVFFSIGLLTLPWYIGTIIRIVIEVRLGWSNLSSLGQAATIVFALEAPGFFAYLVPPPLTQVLFVVDRFRDAGGLSPLDVSYVVLSLLGNFWLVFSLVLIVRRCIHAFMYKVWLQSYSPRWPEDSGWAWKAYFAEKNSSFVRAVNQIGD